MTEMDPNPQREQPPILQPPNYQNPLTPPPAPIVPTKKSHARYWLLAGLLVLVLAAIAVGMWWMLFRASPAPDVAADQAAPATNTAPAGPEKAHVETQCYSFVLPAGYQADADDKACTVTLTKEGDSEGNVTVTLFTTDLTAVTHDIAGFVNSRYATLAQEGNQKVYQTARFDAAKYPAAVIYFDSPAGRKKVIYTIENTPGAAKAEGQERVTAFTITGYGDKTEYDGAAKQVASSFVIKS